MDSILAMRNRVSEFSTIPTHELRDLALSHEVQGLMLTHLYSARQEKDVRDAHSLVEDMQGTLSDMESRYVDEKNKWEAEKKKLKEDSDVAVKRLRRERVAEKDLWEEKERDLVQVRNALMVCCGDATQDYVDAMYAVGKMGDANVSLKKDLASKFVDGFRACVDQMKALFPNLDPDLLSQMGVTKKVENGKVVPLLCLLLAKRPRRSKRRLLHILMNGTQIGLSFSVLLIAIRSVFNNFVAFSLLFGISPPCYFRLLVTNPGLCSLN
ncbi:hypothetical protein TSUD_85480 [Trifolium subterraneum]|uniref:Uncharacterized protein n=1 Tax=Trifolium subterraneum TaxID=3900 RepID=A0A1B5Z8H2_TRISU|nr:hypothetical protein TSUD_85480 [Trifolium subterraneum]